MPDPPITLTPKVKPLPFITDAKQRPISNCANLLIALHHDPRLKQKPWFDQFLGSLMTGDPPRPWTDADVVRLTTYLEGARGFRRVPLQDARAAAECYASDHARNCLQDWLRSLTWDGVARIENALGTYWGATPHPETQPHSYIRDVSRNFFLGLVARAMRPGCQLDEMVVFEGIQGIGKTSALRILGGPWHTEAKESVTRKDFFQDIRGKWVIEISELTAFSHARIERIKHVISTAVDRYRPSYARYSQDIPRSCVFAGTTNDDDWGQDPSGLRRFNPVRCGTIQAHALQADREQLFAEAYQRYHAGDAWWTTPAMAESVRHNRQASDPWSPYLETFLAGKRVVAISDILENALKLAVSEMDKRAEMRVARLLRLSGWTRRSSTILNEKGWWWYAPEL